MKLRNAVFIFLLLLNISVFFEPSFAFENSSTPIKNEGLTDLKSTPALSVFLYLPLEDTQHPALTRAQSQMLVTPTTTYTVRTIRVTSYPLSLNGTCSSLTPISGLIDNGVGVTVQLVSGHTYSTTDASNWALNSLLGLPIANPLSFFDLSYQLLDNSLNNIGNSVCVQGTNNSGDCTSSTNCGWNTTQIWTP